MKFKRKNKGVYLIHIWYLFSVLSFFLIFDFFKGNVNYSDQFINKLSAFLLPLGFIGELLVFVFVANAFAVTTIGTLGIIDYWVKKI